MIPPLHRAVVIGALIGAIVGVFINDFLFYPPHAHWDEGFNFDSAAAWLTALGTIGAVMVALGFNVYQHVRELAAQRETRSAIANALTIDLETMSKFLFENRRLWIEQRDKMDGKTLDDWLKRIQWLVLPSFDAYRETLPKLGDGVAPHVVEAYGIIVRLAHIAKGQTTTSKTYETDREFANMVCAKIPNVLLAIWRALEVLRPFTKALEICGEPTMDQLAGRQ